MILLARSLLILLGVDALTFFLMKALPNAGVLALGLRAGDRQALAAFWADRPMPSYFQQLHRLVFGDLGQTIDGAAVSNVLVEALRASAPWFGLGIAAAFAAVVALSRLRSAKVVERWVDGFGLVNWIPPFVVPFGVSTVLFASAWVTNPAAIGTAVAFGVLVPSFQLLGTNWCGSYLAEQRAEYGPLLAVNGSSLRRIAILRREAAIAETFRVADRALVAALVSLLLAEPLLGIPGLGTLTARAIETADPNLTMGCVLTLATIVILGGLLCTWLRSIYVGWVARPSF